MELLHPIVRDQCLRLQRACRGRGVVLTVTQTLRSHDEQAALWAIGRTEPGNIVTHAPPGYSWHEFGLAFDVAIARFPSDTTPNDLYDGPWQLVGDEGEKVGLEWAGRWKHPDRPHFENRMFYTLAQLRVLHPHGLGAGEVL